jgi:hypothetical protein
MTLLILLTLLVQDPVFPDVDPAPAIEAARKKAETNNRRVLVVWGMNEPDASIPFAKLLKSDKQVARLILYEYDVVLADIRRMKGEVKPAVIPILEIQDAGGRVLASQAGGTDVEALLKFLRRHAAPPLNAKDVLEAALKKADAEKKRVLLAFGAPW